MAKYEYALVQGRLKDNQLLTQHLDAGWRIVDRSRHPTRPDMDEWLLERPVGATSSEVGRVMCANCMETMEWDLFGTRLLLQEQRVPG